MTRSRPLPNWVLRLGVLASFLALFPLMGCEGDYRPRAVGKEGVVTVVMDSSLWTGAVGEALRNNITPWIETVPVTERYFEIRHMELRSERIYDRIQSLKNVVIVAPLSDSTNETTFLRRRFTDGVQQAIQNGQTAVVPKPNLWRRSQRVYYVAAATPEGLIDAFENQGREIRGTFKEVTLQRMKREMYKGERQRSLEDSLLNRHGFSVNLQSDYLLAVDSVSESRGFVWLRRLLAKTRREFFVYYVDDMSPDEITPEWVYETRDSLTRKYMQGNVAGFARIDYRRPLETRQHSFLDRYGYDSQGLWYMVVPTEQNGQFRPVGGGGPFVNYTFYDQATDRVYMIDGSVFAPGFDKLQFLRQMEVTARTFRTAEEAESMNRSVATAE